MKIGSVFTCVVIIILSVEHVELRHRVVLPTSKRYRRCVIGECFELIRRERKGSRSVVVIVVITCCGPAQPADEKCVVLAFFGIIVVVVYLRSKLWRCGQANVKLDVRTTLLLDHLHQCILINVAASLIDVVVCSHR